MKTAVACDAISLLQGRVHGVSVAGERWSSPLGLTAERFDIVVGAAALDVPAVAAGRIVLRPPQPRGAARALFNAADFGRLLVHPLTAAAAAPSGFAFDGSSAGFCGGSGDAIGFRCTWRGGRFALELRPDVAAPPAPARSFALPGAPAAAAAPSRGQAPYSSRVCVRGEPLGPETGEEAAAAALAAASFFNSCVTPSPAALPQQSCGAAAGTHSPRAPRPPLPCFLSPHRRLVIDLSGAELSFDGMRLLRPGLVDLVDLQLALLVRNFPPLDLKF